MHCLRRCTYARTEHGLRCICQVNASSFERWDPGGHGLDFLENREVFNIDDTSFEQGLGTAMSSMLVLVVVNVVARCHRLGRGPATEFNVRLSSAEIQPQGMFLTVSSGRRRRSRRLISSLLTLLTPHTLPQRWNTTASRACPLSMTADEVLSTC